MKGGNSLSINQSTIIEAMQMYFDAQLSTKQIVKSVKKDTSKYAGCDEFIVDFCDTEETTS